MLGFFATECTIIIFYGGQGVVDGVWGNSERCLKWGSGYRSH